MNAQVSKSFKNRLDIYLGVENLLNFQQPNAILDGQNPFGNYFDASMIWGPIFGRMVYAGFRFKM
jgi:outer membrane receptor for ferrienterochelin and colicins